MINAQDLQLQILLEFEKLKAKVSKGKKGSSNMGDSRLNATTNTNLNSILK